LRLKSFFYQHDPGLKDRIVGKLAFAGFVGFQEEDPVLADCRELLDADLNSLSEKTEGDWISLKFVRK